MSDVVSVAEAEKNLKATAGRTANVLYAHMCANIIGICVVLQGRPALVLANCGGNSAAMAAALANMSAGVGVLEFLLNATAGRLSDAFGRRFFLYASPVVNLLLKAGVFVTQSPFMLAAERVVNGAITTLAGSTMCSTMLSDLYSGAELSKSYAMLGSAAGAGAIIGSFLGGRIMAAGYGAKATFGVAAVLAGLQLLMDMALVPETLLESRRKPFDMKFPYMANPLVFTTLFGRTKALRMLTLTAGLQCVPEGKNISDLQQIKLMSDIGVDDATRGNFVSMFGACMVAGGKLAGISISTLGRRGHTTLNNLLTILSFCVFGFAKNMNSMWFGLLLLLPSMERRAATSAMATDHAVASGMGRGEFQAAFANFRALTVVAAPLFYGQLYARLGDRAAYLGGAAVVAIAELCHRSLSSKDLELPDKSASAASKPSKASDAAAFDAVTVVPPDPVFFVSQQYQACTAEIKLNLGVGAYRTNDGKPLVLDVVKKAEQMVTDKLSDDSFNIEYLPIDGLPAFRAETTKLILGKTSPAIAEGRVACCQSLSGTGALRLAAEFIAVNLGTNRTVHISNPTWGNHKAIFGKAGLPVAQYSYFKPETKGLDFEGMTADLEKVKPGDVVLLHGCAHNPTGVDPTMDQWKQIAALIKQQKALPFFDCAYQGYASGDLDTDAAAVRYFESEGIEMMIAQSYSKNFGLYGERIGALSITTNDGPEIAKAIQSQLKKIVRPMYSNPPSNGARIVAQVLADPALYAEWVAELKGMSGRIIEMRAALRKGLEELKPDMDWTFITTQIGMFAYTGLSEAQVERLTKEFNIFMLKSGRISMAGVSSGTVQYLAESIAKVV